MINTRKVDKKDITKEGLLKIVKRDIEEINHLSDSDLMSLWDFFKFLIIDPEKERVDHFMTPRNSIIGQNKDVLERKYGITIIISEEHVAG